ncbi:MAG TPA: efflux RND transporter permease subunit [Calditrichaeota bacterium]|nr:efflux RND transporter permease subunit [Calditrichota bacterium]
MKKIIEFFIRYKIWTNVVMFSVFGFGLIFLSQMRYSFFPEVKPGLITIQVVYPGASPEEVEEGVVLKIEENIEGLPGVEQVTSTSRENFGNVVVEISRDADLDKVLNDVKNAVDQINSFPLDAEKPVIFEQKYRTRSLGIALYGETDLHNLKTIADHFRDELLALEEISQVKIDGLPRLEFSIEVAERDLRCYKLSFDDIRRAVAAANVNITGGKFDTKSEEILIRAYGRRYSAKELYDIPVRGNPDGTVLYLKDIATIQEKWEDVPDRTYYNDKPTVILSIDQTESEDILAIAEKAKAMVASFNETHSQIHATVIDDRTIPLMQRLQLLIKNGLFGLFLVVIALGFFLNLRLSFWVSVGIPFSFLGMFILVSLSGIAINVISLFGMIIVVGILVDDAIVVAENIYAHYERGKSALDAARDGTVEMLAPVSTSVVTTILAFLPFFFLDGRMGKFMWQMALVVISALLFSLIEAFIVLPAHLKHSKGLHPHQQNSPLRKKIERIINRFTHQIYAPALRTVLKHKWITIVMPIAFVFITLGLLVSGIIGRTIFPFIDGDTLPVNISLVPGTQEATTDSILTEIERIAWQVNKEMSAKRTDGHELVLSIRRDIGKNDFGENGSHTGKITLELLNGEIRQMDSYLIANRLREAVGAVPEAQKISFGRTSMFGKPVSISLLGSNITQLNRARDLMVQELGNFGTLRDITESSQEGRREINITLKPRAYALGLTLRDVAGQVRQGFFGQEIQRIQRGKDEIRVWVRYRPQDRANLSQLDQMRIRTPTGEYPFSQIARYDIKRGISTINHLNRLREIRVEASLANEDLDVPPILDKIQNEVVPRILSQTQGVRVSFEGQSRDQTKFQRSVKKVFPVALLGMLILVILVFRSYLQAMMIFSLIPIGILGAVWGHGIQGLQVSILSMFGLIALSGIIINDSIVLIDQVNRNLRAGQKVVDAVYNAGISRLRPILLTTLTTAFGLGPLIMETSRQAQFLIPMAVSVAYGLLFGTFILLLLLPALFLVMNKFRYWTARFFSDTEVTYESVEPALKELQQKNRRTI